MKAVIADLARQRELKVGRVAKQPVQSRARQLHDEQVVRGVPHCVVDHAFQFFRRLCVARRFRARRRQVRRMHGGNAVEQVFFQRRAVARVGGGCRFEMGLGHADILVAEGHSG